MAGNMDPNEIQGIAEAMEELRQGSTLSAESLTKLGGNSTTAYKALEGYTKSLLGATGALGGMAKAVAQGEGSFASLGSTIVGLTATIGKLASIMPVIGGAAKALAEGVGEASKFVLDQLDVMAKNYQTLGDASAGAADGVDGLLRQFNQMGNYSLPAFTRAVKANTLGLSALSGTAALGAEELSKVSGVLTTGNMAAQFLRLGISLDGVGDATANFVANNSRLGLLQGDTTDELTKKTQNYILEVDKIARLTGRTREQQQQEARKTEINVRFRAKLAEMAANGQEKQAAQLQRYADGMGDAAGEVIRASATGIPQGKEAAQAGILFNDAFRQNIESIKAGKQATDAINDTMLAGAAGAERFNKTLQFSENALGATALQALDYEQQIRANLKKGMTPIQAAEAAQKAQLAATGKTTKEFVNAQVAIAESSKNLQSLGFSLAIYATPAVKTFAEVLSGATGLLRDKFGIAPDDNNNKKPSLLDRFFGLFSSGTGKLTGVNSNLADAVTKAIDEYKARTGKDATITRGVATSADQQRLYNESVAAGRPGIGPQGYPIAKPGTSQHERSNAVDINRSAADDMDRMGILTKYGLNRPLSDDPVHVELAGPRSGYKSQTVNSPAAGEETQQQNLQNLSSQQSSDGYELLSKKLTETNDLLRQNNAQNARLLKEARA